jgi:hypothetical protein
MISLTGFFGIKCCCFSKRHFAIINLPIAAGSSLRQILTNVIEVKLKNNFFPFF